MEFKEFESVFNWIETEGVATNLTYDEIMFEYELYKKKHSENFVIPVVGRSLEEKYTPTIEDYLTEVEGFNISDTESYIEDYSLNFNKYQKKYKRWLKKQP